MQAIPTVFRSRIAAPCSRVPALLAIAFAFSTLSCAAPAELARRSESALTAGDTRQAYRWAERAMKADPDLPRARAAMAAAIGAESADWQHRIRALAAADTIAAARLTGEFAEVRAKVGGWGIPVPLDDQYLDDEHDLRHAAARQLYDRGVAQDRAGRPREAYRLFTEAGEIVPGFRDVAERAHVSFEKGITRIAIVPFEDDAGAPGLTSQLATDFEERISSDMSAKKYPFVRFVADRDVQALAAVETRMTRETAIRIGRAVGASRVVWGRISSLRTDTDRNTWNDTIYRKVTEKGEDGKERVRYEPVPIETVERIRHVSVAWSFEVVETDEERTLAAREGTEGTSARVQFTRSAPRGKFDEYTFAPADWKGDRRKDWDSAEEGWKKRHGDWSVAEFLSAASERRDTYRSRNRDSYFRSSRPWVGDALPPPEELAFVALRDVANPIFETLRNLDRDDSK